MYKQKAIEQFGIKQADFGSLLPAIALPALGMYFGDKYFGNKGKLIGGITGGLSGQLLREKLTQQNLSGIDPNMLPQPLVAQPNQPYTIDPTTEDIPAWALQGARALKQAGILNVLLKQAEESAADWALGEVPGLLPVTKGYQAYKQKGLLHGLGQGAKTFGGMALGGVPGALLGLGLGKGIERLTGHPQGLRIPLINLKLHELLGGLGGSIGAVKGYRALTGEGH